MVSPLVLGKSVLTLFLMIIPGFLLRKGRLADDNLPKGFSNTIMYVTQPAMIVASFIRPFTADIMVTIAGVFVFSFVAHLIFFLVARKLFSGAPEDKRRVLRYGVIFSNAGYMGIPLIMAVLGSEAAIYASVYVIWFNVFSWSVGRMIYTDDRSYISIKKILFNPAVIAIFIGLAIFLLPVDGYVPGVVVDVLEMLRATVAPMSMMLIGMRLADVNWGAAFKDKYIYQGIAVRLFLFPVIIWAVMRLVMLTGIYTDMTAVSVVLISASTPCAAATSMFAERFGGNTLYAGQFVSVTTLLSMLTMPLICLLLQI